MAGARRAGFRYTVITTKHHDGYALWDSDWALMGVRQYLDGQCLIKPFVEACRNNDVKVGFYYSGMDWYHERNYINFALGTKALMDFRGEWVVGLPKRTTAHWESYKQFNLNQVEELISKFQPDIWWGDGGHGASVEKIRQLRPGIVCNNRDAGSGDHASAEGYSMAHPRFIRKPVLENGWWWELCTIIQGGSWHYDARKGEKIFATDAILRSLAEARCMGGNLLANIGPRPDGTFPDEVWRFFDEMEAWMQTNEESVFGINGGGPWPEKCNVPITVKDRNWYFHARQNHATQSNPIVLKECPAEPIRVTCSAREMQSIIPMKRGLFVSLSPSPLKQFRSPMSLKSNSEKTLIRNHIYLPIGRIVHRELRLTRGYSSSISHSENVAACPTVAPVASNSIQIFAPETRKR